MKIISSSPIGNSDFLAEVPTYMGRASTHLFAVGFLEIAELASQKSIRNECAIDAVIPAILYSFRHSVELFLKYAMVEVGAVESGRSLHGHDVLKIFDLHEGRFVAALDCEVNAGFQSQDWLRKFKSLLKAIHAVDGDGQEIRYPADHKLNPNKGGGYVISTVNLANCIAEARLIYQEFDQRNC